MSQKNRGFNRSFNFVFLTALLITLVGCAHAPVEQSLSGKLAAESEMTDYEQMNNESKVIIEKTNLTDDQKKKLLFLKLETAKKMDQFDKELMKLKGVLLRNIVSDKYAPKEVVAIEKKIENLSKKKLETFFAALETGSAILGKTSTKEQVLDNLRFERSFRIREGLTERY